MRILVVGSTGLIGKHVAEALIAYGDVIGVSRTTPISVDVKDPSSIKKMYEKVGKVNHVVSCIGKVTFKPINEISYDEYATSLKDKALGQVELVRAGINHDSPLHIGGKGDPASFTLHAFARQKSGSDSFAGKHLVEDRGNLSIGNPSRWCWSVK